MKTILIALLALVVLVILQLGVFYLISGHPAPIKNQVIIHRSQETVFDFIADMTNELKWNPDVQVMEKQSAGPVGLGTHFRAKWSLSPMLDVEITRFDRPHDVTFANGGPLEVKLELNVTSRNNQTELNTTFSPTPHGFLRAIFPIMKRSLIAQERENMVNLKKVLESNG